MLSDAAIDVLLATSPGEAEVAVGRPAEADEADAGDGIVSVGGT